MAMKSCCKLDRVMSSYATIDELFNVLSCLVSTKLMNWNDVWKLKPEHRVRCCRFAMEDLLGWPARSVSFCVPLKRLLWISTAF